jgi:WD40 repeat protein
MKLWKLWDDTPASQLPPRSDAPAPLPRGDSAQILSGHTSEVVAAVMMPDGKYVISASPDKTVRIWNPRDEKLLMNINIGDNWVRGMARSADGRLLAVADWGGSVHLWDMSKWPFQRTREMRADNIQYHWDTAITAKGQRVLTVGVDGKLRIWDTRNGEIERTIDAHSGAGKKVIVSPDDRYALTVGEDGNAKLFVISSGREVRTYRAGNGIHAVAISPDSKFIAAGCNDSTVRVLDAATGSEVHNLQHHSGRVTAVAFSPDGRYILSGGSDSTVKLWETAPRIRVIQTFKGHTAGVMCVAFSPDGKTAISGANDKTVRLWPLE